MPSQEIGVPIPSNTPHAVSVTLPTWEATIGYEEGEDWVVSKMSLGYPRFFIHSVIQELAKQFESKYGREGENCMIFPLYNTAKKCREFIKTKSSNKPTVRVLQLSTRAPKDEEEKSNVVETTIGVCFFPLQEFAYAKNYWQHSGEGILSRLGEYLLKELGDPSTIRGKSSHNIHRNSDQEQQVKALQLRSPLIVASQLAAANSEEESRFIEQKFGRVLDLKFAPQAKVALRRRISGKADTLANQIEEMEKAQRGKNLSETDVYLYPLGMALIFNAHQAVLSVGQKAKSVCFGFPYVDTLNILRKWGEGCIFLGHGDDKLLDKLEEELANGLQIALLFCECPLNPLLKTPDLARIRKLADKYNFLVCIDETVGNFLNVHVLPYADLVASSLTKVFSGDLNVMAGLLILNPSLSWYHKLKAYFNENYEDLFWAEDALYLERNSRDFAERSARINVNTDAAVNLLLKLPLVEKLYYPLILDLKDHYDAIKTAKGGYGGLFSFLFKDPADAVCFFNTINIHKGPSLGTNFTLACPYAILAHYQELDEIAQWDIDRNLIRISVGMEETSKLLQVLEKGLEEAAAQHK